MPYRRAYLINAISPLADVENSRCDRFGFLLAPSNYKCLVNDSWLFHGYSSETTGENGLDRRESGVKLHEQRSGLKYYG